MRPNTRVVFLEAPGSNTFEMMDVAEAAGIARAHGAVSMLDNTWATPLHFRPLEHGVDLSIHALTKYPGGHSDLLMGSVSATRETFGRLRDAQMQLGINVSAEDAYLVFRGMKTMELRINAHEAATLRLARWLEARGRRGARPPPRPALVSRPRPLEAQFSGSTGLFSFVLKGGGRVEAAAFLDALSLFGLGYSWGGFESLALEVDLSDRRVATAPTEGPVIRLQIGLEDVADLQADLEAGVRGGCAPSAEPSIRRLAFS